MKINYQAVRAFNRVWQPIAEQLDMGAACDHQFDGGEWSDAASANLYQDEMDTYCRKVGVQFGMTGAELMDHLQDAAHTETRCFQDSHLPMMLRKQAE